MQVPSRETECEAQAGSVVKRRTLDEVLDTPARRAQFAYLQQSPVGSVRDLAKRWKISAPAVQRFFNGLRAAGIAVKGGTTCTIVDVESVSGVSGQANTVAESVLVPDTVNPPILALSVSGEADTLRHLDSLDSTLDSRCQEDRYTERLIDLMNAELAPRFSDYWRVSRDNHGSHRTGNELQAKGVPFNLAADELALACRRFNPEKHGNGQLPKSLGLFKRGILSANNRRLKRERDAQRELGFPPRLVVDSPAPSAYAPEAGNDKPFSAEAVAAAMSFADVELTPEKLAIARAEVAASIAKSAAG